jgi:Zn-finger nucleic acid-binding protein
MDCALCKVQLRTTEHLNITKDYCPKCLGLWLGDGIFNELVKQPNT